MAAAAPWPLPTTGGATRNPCRLNRLVPSDLEEPHVRLGWVRESSNSSSSGGRGGIMGRIEEREEGRKATQKSEKKKRSKEEEEQEEEQQEVREERGGVSLAC